MYKRNPGILDDNKTLNGKTAYYFDTLDPDPVRIQSCLLIRIQESPNGSTKRKKLKNFKFKTYELALLSEATL